MFSITRGQPIALIQGGKYDGEIVGLVSGNDCCHDHISVGKQQCTKKKRCCDKCDCEDDKDGDFDGKKDIQIPDGCFVPLPKQHEREIDFIAARSGAGKTTVAAKLIKVFHKINPKSPIIIFSRAPIENDPALAGIPMNQINLEELPTVSIDITRDVPMGSMIVFDDTDTIQDNQIKKIVDGIMTDIMEVGRKLKLYTIITQHLILGNDKKKSRTIMNECQYFTCFPKACSAQQIKYALNSHFGFCNKEIQKILDTDSRWVRISKEYPQYIMSERSLRLTN
jgi:hypothetical protein